MTPQQAVAHLRASSDKYAEAVDALLAFVDGVKKLDTLTVEAQTRLNDAQNRENAYEARFKEKDAEIEKAKVKAAALVEEARLEAERIKARAHVEAGAILKQARSMADKQENANV